MSDPNAANYVPALQNSPIFSAACGPHIQHSDENSAAASANSASETEGLGMKENVNGEDIVRVIVITVVLNIS